MDMIEDKVRQVLHQKLFFLEYGRRNPFVTEWKEIRQVVESLIPTITGLVNEEREETVDCKLKSIKSVSRMILHGIN